jgi:hypothetical protein
VRQATIASSALRCTGVTAKLFRYASLWARRMSATSKGGRACGAVLLCCALPMAHPNTRPRSVPSTSSGSVCPAACPDRTCA